MLYDIEAPSSSMMLIFLYPRLSSSLFTFISTLFDMSIEMLPVMPLPGPP